MDRSPERALDAVVRAIAFVAGILTPGGPMVTVPFLVAPANSDAAMAGWLVKTFYRD